MRVFSWGCGWQAFQQMPVPGRAACGNTGRTADVGDQQAPLRKSGPVKHWAEALEPRDPRTRAARDRKVRRNMAVSVKW
jgi:hypothetical protein